VLFRIIHMWGGHHHSRRCTQNRPNLPLIWIGLTNLTMATSSLRELAKCPITLLDGKIKPLSHLLPPIRERTLLLFVRNFA